MGFGTDNAAIKWALNVSASVVEVQRPTSYCEAILTTLLSGWPRVMTGKPVGNGKNGDGNRLQRSFRPLKKLAVKMVND